MVEGESEHHAPRIRLASSFAALGALASALPPVLPGPVSAILAHRTAPGAIPGRGRLRVCNHHRQFRSCGECPCRGHFRIHNDAQL